MLERAIVLRVVGISELLNPVLLEALVIFVEVVIVVLVEGIVIAVLEVVETVAVEVVVVLKVVGVPEVTVKLK